MIAHPGEKCMICFCVFQALYAFCSSHSSAEHNIESHALFPTFVIDVYDQTSEVTWSETNHTNIGTGVTYLIVWQIEHGHKQAGQLLDWGGSYDQHIVYIDL